MARVFSRIEDTIDKISKGVDLLKELGICNLALGATWIGVSIVGFGIVTAKLNQVQCEIKVLGDKLDSISDKVDRLRQDAIDADLSHLFTLTGLYEEGWEFLENARAEQQWHHVQQEALRMQNRFADRAQKLLTASTANIVGADAMLDAVSLASGLRIASLVACNESVLARTIAGESARQIESLTGSIEAWSSWLPTQSMIG